MAQDIAFSHEGIELSFSISNEALIVFLTLKESGRSIEKRLSGEALSRFQIVVSRLNYTQFRLVNQLEIERVPAKDELGNAIRQQLIAAFEGKKLAPFSNTQFFIPQKIKADVFIGLPQEDIDIFTIERIQNATGDFMEAMGFELKAQDEPVFGSFYQRFIYLLNGEVKQEVSELYRTGKDALNAQLVDLPSAEATSKLLGSAADVIRSLEGVGAAAIRCGSILIVKVTREGVPEIVVETISYELAALLNKNPALLRNPSIVFDLISGMRVPDRAIEEGDSTELAE